METPSAIRRELLRKGIHVLIAFVPAIAHASFPLAVGLLGGGVLVYACCEGLRLHGHAVPLVSRLTALASREREAGRFVLGPLTLGLGALSALLLYRDPAASIAIYALALGDGLAGLVGKAFGRVRLPFTDGKSLEGSLACAAAVFLSAWVLTSDAPRSLAVAAVATLAEAAPTKAFDNIVLPVVAGAAAAMLF
jgi:dolichol kinase